MSHDNFDKIPFAAEVVGSGKILEVRVTKEVIDGCRRISARDLIAVVCRKNADDAGKAWRELPAEYRNDIEEFARDIKFTGRGQQTQPGLSLQGCFKLLMVLNNENARRFRSASARVLLGLFAGDEALVEEVRKNAQNTDFLNELAREELREVQAAEGGAAPAPAAEPAMGPAAPVIDELKQRELAVALGKQELALQRACAAGGAEEARGGRGCA